MWWTHVKMSKSNQKLTHKHKMGMNLRIEKGVSLALLNS